MNTTFRAERAPWHRSSLWQLATAYFKVGGLAAWDTNVVPSYATSNTLSARRAARLLVALAEDHDGPLAVLEIGAGHGRFAGNVLDALRRDTGPGGRAVYERLTYVIADLAADNVRALLQRDYLAEHRAHGRLVPAVADLMATPLVTRLGEPLPDRFHAVISNYVCCALPPRVLQRRDDDWYELEVEAMERDGAFVGELGGLFERLDVRFTWAPGALAARVPAPHHRRAITTLCAPFARATLVYPETFLDALHQRVAPLLAPGGIVVTSDYGDVQASALDGLRDVRPQTYGGSLAHGVCFPAFAAFAEALGWGEARSDDALASVHTALLSPSGPVRATYRSVLGDTDSADRLLDLLHAAAQLTTTDPTRAPPAAGGPAPRPARARARVARGPGGDRGGTARDRDRRARRRRGARRRSLRRGIPAWSPHGADRPRRGRDRLLP